MNSPKPDSIQEIKRILNQELSCESTKTNLKHENHQLATEFDPNKYLFDRFSKMKNSLRKKAPAAPINVNGINIRPADPVSTSDPSLDAYINDVLGAKREGLRVVWNTSEGIYKFDPFTLKLTKVIE